MPGDDLSAIPEDEATAIAVGVAARLWRPCGIAVPAGRTGGCRVGSIGRRARVANSFRSHESCSPRSIRSPDWLVHGDFHHHNILRHGERFVAIDPKPYLADREYDLPSFLWNPLDNRMEDREQTERRIAAFVTAGLDDFRIRAWTVIRGAYLRPGYADPIRALL